MRKHLHVSRKFGCGGVHKSLLHLALHNNHLGNLVGSGSPAVLKNGGKMVSLTDNLQHLRLHGKGIDHNEEHKEKHKKLKPLHFKL